MEPPPYPDDCYYSTDTQKFTDTPHIPQQVFASERWHNHLQQHQTFLPDHAPRIKQEESPSYPHSHHNHQPTNYDAHLLSSHANQPNPSGPYATFLSPLQTGSSQQLTSYSSYSMRQPHHHQFLHLHQPAYHPQAYSRDTVHAAEVPPTTYSCPSLLSLSGYATDQAGIVECDPHSISAMHPDTHLALQQNNIMDPVSHALEGWNDDIRSSLSSFSVLAESQLEVENMDMDEMSILGVDGVVENTVGDEDAEGEDEWNDVGQQPNPQSIDEVEVGDRDAHVHVEHELGDGDSFEESEDSEDDDPEFVLNTRSSRKVTVYTSDSGLSYNASERKSSRPRSQSARYNNPYATHSSTDLYYRESAERQQVQGQSLLTHDHLSVRDHWRHTSASSTSSPSPSVSHARSSSITKRIPGGHRRGSHLGSSPNTFSLPVPIPVPNLTKKSRGRRVPTISSLEDIRSAASGAGRKRQGMSGKGVRMYLCEVEGCGKCFARGEHLKRHVRSIHTYEKPHRCPYPGCGKDFSRHDNLVQHLRVHKDYVPPSSTSSPQLLASVATQKGVH